MKAKMKAVSLKVNAPKTCTQLRESVLEVFSLLGRAKIHPAQAKEMNNAAGKAISSAKVQLDYHRDRKEKPEIPWLK